MSYERHFPKIIHSLDSAFHSRTTISSITPTVSGRKSSTELQSAQPPQPPVSSRDLPKRKFPPATGYDRRDSACVTDSRCVLQPRPPSRQKDQSDSTQLRPPSRLHRGQTDNPKSTAPLSVPQISTSTTRPTPLDTVPPSDGFLPLLDNLNNVGDHPPSTGNATKLDSRLEKLQSRNILELDSNHHCWTFQWDKLSRKDAKMIKDFTIPLKIRGLPVVALLPRVPTKPPANPGDPWKDRPIDPLVDRLSYETYRAILDYFPFASDFCYWMNGHLQLIAPDLSRKQISRLEIPPSFGGLIASVSRYRSVPTVDQAVDEPSPLQDPTGDHDSHLNRQSDGPSSPFMEYALQSQIPPSPTRDPNGTTTLNTDYLPHETRDSQTRLPIRGTISNGEPSSDFIYEEPPPKDTGSIPQSSQATEADNNTAQCSTEEPAANATRAPETSSDASDAPRPRPPPLLMVPTKTPAAADDTLPTPNPYPPSTATLTSPTTNGPLKLQVGDYTSTAGLLVQDPNTKALYLTASKHAICTGKHGKPLRTRGQKKRLRFHLTNIFPWMSKRRTVEVDIDNVEVFSAETKTLVGKVSPDYTWGPHKIDTTQPFPEAFIDSKRDVADVCFLKLKNDESIQALLPPRDEPLTFYNGGSLTRTTVGLLHDPENTRGESICLGAFYNGGMEIKTDPDPTILICSVVRGSILYRRRGTPLRDCSVEKGKWGAGQLSGMAVVTAKSIGKGKEPAPKAGSQLQEEPLTQVVGFQSFEFAPPDNGGEWGGNDAEIENMWKSGKMCVCGATRVPDGMKSLWILGG